jgi:hypothetical protein
MRGDSFSASSQRPGRDEARPPAIIDGPKQTGTCQDERTMPAAAEQSQV